MSERQRAVELFTGGTANPTVSFAAWLGQGSRRIYDAVRSVAGFLDRDRPMEDEITAVAAEIAAGRVGCCDFC